MALRIDFLNQILRDNFLTDIFDFIALIYTTIVSIGGTIVETLGFIGDVIGWSFDIVRATLNFFIEAMVFLEWIRSGSLYLPEVIVSCLFVLVVGLILKLLIDVFI